MKHGKNVGVETLVAIRRFTQRSIDDLLELSPLDSDVRTAKLAAAVISSLRERGEVLALPPEPKPQPKRRTKDA